MNSVHEADRSVHPYVPCFDANSVRVKPDTPCYHDPEKFHHVRELDQLYHDLMRANRAARHISDPDAPSVDYARECRVFYKNARQDWEKKPEPPTSGYPETSEHLTVADLLPMEVWL